MPKNPKIVEKISGHEINIERKPMIKNSKVESVMITATSTRKAITSGSNEGTPLDYDDVKEWFNKNKKVLIKKKNQMAQINVLTDQGWRASYAFNAEGGFEWFSRMNQYKEKQEIERVYAVQLLLF
jgi:hypothetical protein